MAEEHTVCKNVFKNGDKPSAERLAVKAALYCRLSEEDRNKPAGTCDSGSIQNQKTMLLQYAMEQGWDVFDIYSDDDYAGADRRRPQFNRLLRDAQQHKFDIVLCKTQSRFTRDMELVEKYLHGLFPEWGVRFIAVLDHVDTFADGIAVKTPGDLVFPYVQQNVDRVLALEDGELVEAFLDIMERHKMIVENAGLLTVAALKHLDCKGKNVVSVLSGGNMDVITMSSLVQHGLIGRGRIFTFAVQLPDRPGELMRVADVLARNNGNIIKLEHNQFVNINRQNGVELKVTLEAFGQDHKQQILAELRQNGYSVQEVMTADFYH